MNKANECTCPSGDGSLVHPCPAHPAVEQACWDERKLSDLGNELHNLSCSIVHENEKLAEQIGGIARELWNWPQARAALAQPSPKCSTCGGTGMVDDGEIDCYSDGTPFENGPVKCVKDCSACKAQPSPAQAEQHWPKLEKPAQVGAICFSADVSSRLVVEAAQRLYEFESTPEKEAERIERLQAFREQCFEPLGAEFSKVLSENLVELSSEAKPEQAEAERPEVFGLERYRVEKTGQGFWPYCVRAGDGTRELFVGHLKQCKRVAAQLATAFEDGKFIAQHESIVGGLRAEITQLRQHKNDYMDAGQETYRALQNEIREREAEIARLDGLVSGRTAERDAALARVASLESKLAELEKQDLVDVPGPDEIHQMAFEEGQPADDGDGYLFSAEEFDLFVQRLLDSCAAPVAQAQHSVPEGWVQSLPLKDHQPCKPNEDRANGYTIPIYSRPVLVEEALRKLRAVLCDPIGNVVIDGSDGDREEVQRALGMLAAAPGKEGV
ncbi:hypothetical protein [Pseudomonas aeruginosa]